MLFRAIKSVIFKRRLAHWSTHLAQGSPASIRTKQGIYAIPAVDDLIGKNLFIYRDWESRWIDAVVSFLRGRGKVAGSGILLDIGSNNGVISISMLTKGEFRKAVAVEPDPTNFANLTRNAALNGLSERLVGLNLAAADKPGSLQFELSHDNMGDHRVHATPLDSSAPEIFKETGRTLIDVQAETLDSMVAQLPRRDNDDIALIWMDVQGYEGFALEGARELIARDIPVVIEAWPYGLHRAGMTSDRFIELVQQNWGAFWVQDGDTLRKLHSKTFAKFFTAIDPAGGFEDIILTKD